MPAGIAANYSPARSENNDRNCGNIGSDCRIHRRQRGILVNTNNQEILNEVVSAMGVEAAEPLTSPIDLNKVKEWMLSDDLEVLGAVFELLMNRRYADRVKPELTLSDYQGFVTRYYERCMLEDPDGDWADSRYSAGWSLVNWFKGLWDDSDVPRSVVADTKSWIARVYKEGDQEIRTCLITATLEHLFERRDIQKFFQDWKQDDVLRTAYSEAAEWKSRAP